MRVNTERRELEGGANRPVAIENRSPQWINLWRAKPFTGTEARVIFVVSKSFLMGLNPETCSP